MASATELALLLIGTRERREAASARIAALVAAGDEDGLTRVLVEQRVLLLAGSRLLDLVPAAMSASFRQYLDEAYARACVRAMAFSALTSRVTEALEQASIPAVALKGPMLAAELYGDGALREYADIDILVARADLDRAAALARTLGWTEVDQGGRRVRQLHCVMRHPAASLPELELHWRIHWYETGFAPALLARSQTGDGLRRLDPVDQLAALLLFYARDGFAGLRFPADIAAWWDRHGSMPVPAALEKLMGAHPALAEPWRAALAAVVPVAGLPAEALAGSSPPQRRRSVLAARLSNWDLRGDVDQIHANVTLVDGLLAPQDGLPAFLARRLLRPTNTTSVPHAAKLLARYGFALWQLRRGRSWSPPPPGPPPATADGAARAGFVGG